MRIGSLFSGGGLGDLGFIMAGCEVVFQVEIDDYCQRILNLRWPDVPKWRNIKEVKGAELPKCDIITGGFPCQPFSVAGKQNGIRDNRFLWPEMSRIISEVKPSWVVAENVPGIINLALDDVLDDLEGKGYETITLVFPAHALGANHRRERVWIMGYSAGICSDMANTERTEFTGKWRIAREGWSFSGCGGWWEAEPPVGRVVNGCANRVHRLKLLGNGQVPFVTKWIAERIIEFQIQGAPRHE